MKRSSTDRRHKVEYLHSIAQRAARSGGRMRLLLVGAALLLVAACGREPTEPFPPHSPPRPVTKASGVMTAQLILPARPVRPAPGPM